MVGASGAISGIMGAYIVLYPRVRVHMIIFLGFFIILTHFLYSQSLLIAVASAHAFTVLTLKRSILTEKLSRRGYHLSREYSVDPLELQRDVIRLENHYRRSGFPKVDVRYDVRYDAESGASVVEQSGDPLADEVAHDEVHVRPQLAEAGD